MEQQVVVKAHSGENIVVDISADVVMTTFGFHPGDVVRFTKGRHNHREAVVLGMCEGGLWFRFSDEDAARTVSLRCKEEYLRQCGWVVIS